MKNLNNDWFIEGLQDFEYKKYKLLAYLQHIAKEFAEVKLYPSFSDLIFHYKNLATFKDGQKQLFQHPTGKVSEDELSNFRSESPIDLEHHTDLKELEAIVDYALPAIKGHLSEGKLIYDYIDDQIAIEPVGLTPLYKREGYILLRANPNPNIDVYQYRIVFFENIEANFHGINMTHVESFRYSLVNTYESIKLQLIKENQELPNPATYVVYSDQLLPKEAAFLPVAKRKFLAYVQGQ
ncbi:MAG: hypothetical protein AAGI38_23630 [Bacteroidota bacterium]